VPQELHSRILLEPGDFVAASVVDVASRTAGQARSNVISNDGMHKPQHKDELYALTPLMLGLHERSGIHAFSNASSSLRFTTCFAIFVGDLSAGMLRASGGVEFPSGEHDGGGSTAGAGRSSSRS
jgi:hypothetical protein